jgi:hypothetical protein
VPPVITAEDVRSLASKIDQALTTGQNTLTLGDMRLAAFLLRDFALFIEFTDWKPTGKVS